MKSSLLYLINQFWVNVEIKVIDGQPYKRALLTQKSNQSECVCVVFYRLTGNPMNGLC